MNKVGGSVHPQNKYSLTGKAKNLCVQCTYHLSCGIDHRYVYSAKSFTLRLNMICVVTALYPAHQNAVHYSGCLVVWEACHPHSNLKGNRALTSNPRILSSHGHPCIPTGCTRHRKEGLHTKKRRHIMEHMKTNHLAFKTGCRTMKL